MVFYKPSKLISFLKEHNIFPKKGLSQNFLIDNNIVKKIVADAAHIEESDLVLEIGPGLGVLTNELLKKAKVIAVEKDNFFAEHIAAIENKNLLHVIEGDFLKIDLENTLSKYLKKNQKAKLATTLAF